MPPRTAAIALTSRTTSAGFNHSTWRGALATGVASARAVLLLRPPRARADPSRRAWTCPADGTITCTGDLSPGVQLENGGGPYTVLNVNNLTTDIAPEASRRHGHPFQEQRRSRVEHRHRAFAILSPPDCQRHLCHQQRRRSHRHHTRRHNIITTGRRARRASRAASQDTLLTITSSGNIATSGKQRLRHRRRASNGDSSDQLARRHRDDRHLRHGISVGRGIADGPASIIFSHRRHRHWWSTMRHGIDVADVGGIVSIVSAISVREAGSASMQTRQRRYDRLDRSTRLTSSVHLRETPEARSW